MMRRDRSAAMGGVTAIELTTLKSYSSTIIFIHMRQYCYSRVDSDVSLDYHNMPTRPPPTLGFCSAPLWDSGTEGRRSRSRNRRGGLICACDTTKVCIDYRRCEVVDGHVDEAPAHG